MSATDPNMQQWMNPAQPTQPAQPIQQPIQPQPAQPPVQAVQTVQQWFMNPQTGQNELYELNTELNQWVPVQQVQPPAPVQPPQSPFPAQPPVQPQPPQQPMPGQPMPGQQPLSISQQMELEQMRQANANRATAGNPAVSLKMSLKGVQAGNFNLLPTDLMYESKITKAEVKPTKNKSHNMIVLNLTVVFPNEYRGTMLQNNLNLTEESLGFYRAALESTDLFNYETEEPTLNTEQDFVGKFVRHAVSHREWEGQTRNNINGAFSKAFEADEVKGAYAQPGMPQMPQQPQAYAPTPAAPAVFAPPVAPPVQPQAPPSAPAVPSAPAGFAPPTGYTAPDPNGAQPNVSAPNFGQ